MDHVTRDLLKESDHRIVILPRGRGRGRKSTSRNNPNGHSHPTNKHYVTNALHRGRGRGVKNRSQGRNNNNTHQSPPNTRINSRGRGRTRGRGRGRGYSAITPIPYPNPKPKSKHKHKHKNTNTPIPTTNTSNDSYKKPQMKVWQRTPAQLVHEWCQQHKRHKPRFVNAYISPEELQSFSKRYNIPLQNCASKAYRRRLVLPDKSNDKNKDLSFCTKEVYKTQSHSQHMSSLLALHSLCGSLPLERKLPETYKNIWLSFSTTHPKVHSTSKFKSRKEQQMHESDKDLNRKRRQRKQEQFEYERFADLNRVFMNEDLRVDIQNVLRQEYITIHEENKCNSGNSEKQKQLFSGMQHFFEDQKGVTNKVCEIENTLQNMKDVTGDKIRKFLEKMIGKLVGLGFDKMQSKRAAYLTAGMEFLDSLDSIDEFVKSTENETLRDGVKVIKGYNKQIYDINVGEYVGDGVTWLCLHLSEDELPSKYAARGKQFEISVVNTNAIGFKDKSDKSAVRVSNEDSFDENSETGMDKSVYYWLVQFGFPKRIIAQEIKANSNDCDRYVIFGELYKRLIGEIGSTELVESMSVDISEGMMEENEAMMHSELESLPFMFEDVSIKALSNSGKYKDYVWSKQFVCEDKKGNKCVGILEIYRLMKCESFKCYPLQIPLITFRSPNNTISYEQCQIIIQCLIKQCASILSQEMAFTCMSWVQDNIRTVLRNTAQIINEYKTVTLDKYWGIKGVNKPKEKTEQKVRTVIEHKQKDSKHRNAPTKRNDVFKNKLFAIKKEKSVKRNNSLDEYLYNDKQRKLRNHRKYQQYNRLRSALPAFGSKHKILELIHANQVLVISGETGCGKSTQIPQFILDDYIDNHKGSMVNIVCTQPRRISAVGLADRVSAERCEPVGQTVGYSIRLENKCSDRTKILYCTTGILLRRLMSSLKIQSVTHVIIDEVHERSVDIDFLMVILKFLCEKRKDLKLILMSATLNAQLFSDYFHKCPILEIQGRTFPVKTFFLEDLLSESRISLPKTRWSKILKEDERTRFKNLKEKQIYAGSNYSDRVFHELSKWDERDNHKCEIQLIVDTIFHIIRRYPISADAHTKNNNAILVFLPGMYEINKSEEIFYKDLAKKQMNEDLFWVIPLHSSLATINQKNIFKTPPANVRKIVLSTNIAETSITINDVKYVIDAGKMRQMSFNAQKNVSMLEEIWISKAHSEQRKGRAGRVGNGYCYELYSKDKYYSKMREAATPELLRSSLENVSLKIKLLRTLSLFKSAKNSKGKKQSDIGGIKSILCACIEPPSLESIRASVVSLTKIGTLDKNELLTPLGFHLSKLPVSNVRLGKILIYSSIFKCLTPCLIIAAILTTGKSIYNSYSNRTKGLDYIEKRAMADKLKSKYYNSSLKSDHITMYRFYCEWKRTLLFYHKSSARQYAYDNCLSNIALQQIDGITTQYRNALKDIGFVDYNYRFAKSVISLDEHCLDTNSKSYKLIKAILSAGLYPNCIKVKLPKKKYDKTLTGASERDISDLSAIRFYLHPRHNNMTKYNNGRIFIHGQSCLSKETKFECNWLVYLTKIETGRLQCYDVSMTTPYALLFFGGKITVDHNRQHIIIDNWIRFKAPSRIAVLVSELKKMCNYLLMKKIANPGIDITNHRIVTAIERVLKSDGLE